MSARHSNRVTAAARPRRRRGASMAVAVAAIAGAVVVTLTTMARPTPSPVEAAPAADVPVGDRSCRVCGASESDGRAPDLRMLAGIESPQSPEELLAENLRLKAELASALGVPSGGV